MGYEFIELLFTYKPTKQQNVVLIQIQLNDVACFFTLRLILLWQLFSTVLYTRPVSTARDSDLVPWPVHVHAWALRHSSKPSLLKMENEQTSEHCRHYTVMTITTKLACTHNKSGRIRMKPSMMKKGHLFYICTY